jgi:hypothetical protein
MSNWKRSTPWPARVKAHGPDVSKTRRQSHARLARRLAHPFEVDRVESYARLALPLDVNRVDRYICSTVCGDRLSCTPCAVRALGRARWT